MTSMKSNQNSMMVGASIKASKNQKKRTINEECKDCSICYDMNCETYYKGADDKGNVIHTDLHGGYSVTISIAIAIHAWWPL